LQSILHESKYAERDLIRAATWDAYEYLEIKNNRIPHFLFAGAKPYIDSIADSGPATALGGF